MSFSGFVTTWDTTKGDGTTVTLGLAGTVNALIDWGDGSVLETVTTAGPHVHLYAAEGEYTVRVTGTVSAYDGYFGGSQSERAKLVAVNQWGTTGFTTLYAAFLPAFNLTSLPVDGRGTAAVTNMANMFYGASSLTTVPLFNTAGCCRRWITSEATFLYLLLPGVGLLCGRRRRDKLSSLVTAVTKRLNLGQAAAAQRDAPALWNVCPSYAV